MTGHERVQRGHNFWGPNARESSDAEGGQQETTAMQQLLAPEFIIFLAFAILGFLSMRVYGRSSQAKSQA